MASELEGLKEQLNIIIRKLNYFRGELAKASDAEKKFSLQEEIDNLDKEKNELRLKIREIEKPELLQLRDHIETLSSYISKSMTTSSPDQTILEIIQEAKQLKLLWQLSFSRSLVPSWFENIHLQDLERIAKGEITNESWRKEIFGNIIIPLQITLENKLLPYLDDDSVRLEIESEAQKGISLQNQLEEAYRSFSRLKFDEEHRGHFNLYFKNSDELTVLIHGLPQHGHRWVYNHLLSLKKQELSGPGIFFRPIKLQGPVGEGDIFPSLRKIFGLPDQPGDTEALIESLAQRLIAVLGNKNVVILLDRPSKGLLPELHEFCSGLFAQIERQKLLASNKLLIFITIEEICEGREADSSPLQPIDLPYFKDWINEGVPIDDKLIIGHFDFLYKKDDEYLCRELMELTREETPSVPAEKFIRKVTQEKLGLDWEKCKEQWMPY